CSTLVDHIPILVLDRLQRHSRGRNAAGRSKATARFMARAALLPGAYAVHLAARKRASSAPEQEIGNGGQSARKGDDSRPPRQQLDRLLRPLGKPRRPGPTHRPIIKPRSLL